MNMHTLLAGAALVALTACGNMNQGGPASDVIKRVTSVFSKSDAKAPPALTPALLAAGAGDILVAKLINRDAVAPLTRVGTNGTAVTWRTPAGVTLILDQGILVGTRGLGNDLMGVDLGGTRAALDAGGGTTTRQHALLTSTDQIRQRAGDCTITSDGPATITTVAGEFETEKFSEVCKGQLSLTNSYWLHEGKIVQSLQAISADVGYVLLLPV